MNKILYILIAAILTACTPEAVTDDLDLLPAQEAGAERPVHLAITRTSSNPIGERTYRVLLFNIRKSRDEMQKETRHRVYASRTGTYYDAGTDALTGVLLPWDVENGVADPHKGLFVHDESYNMMVVSPAENKMSFEGSFRKYNEDKEVVKEDDYLAGIKINRITPAGQQDPYLTHFIPVTFNGRGENVEVSATNTVHHDTIHIDTKEEAVMFEPRARLNFTFRCSPLLTEAKIKKVSLRHLPASAWWSPDHDCFEYSTTSMAFEDITIYDGGEVTLTSTGGETLAVPSHDLADLSADGTDYTFVLATDSVRHIDGEYEYTPMTLHVNFYDEVSFDFPIQQHFRPHHTYSYNLIVSSIYVGIDLTVSPWEVGNEGECSALFDDPDTGKFTLGTFIISGWEDGSGGEAGFEDPDHGTTPADGTTVNAGWDTGGGGSGSIE